MAQIIQVYSCLVTPDALSSQVEKVATYPFQYACKWFDVYKSNTLLVYRIMVREAGLNGKDILKVQPPPSPHQVYGET